MKTAKFKLSCLSEHVDSLSKKLGISMQFIKISDLNDIWAMVDVFSNTIFLSGQSFSSKLNPVEVLKIKTLISHECAHILYTKSFVTNKSSTTYFKVIKSLTATIEDICVENRIEQEYGGFKEGFTFLVDQLWQENIGKNLKPGHGLHGDYSNDIMGSLFWHIQQRYRNASLDVPGFKFRSVHDFLPVFKEEIVPIIDNCLTDCSKDIFKEADLVLNVLKKHYPSVFKVC